MDTSALVSLIGSTASAIATVLLVGLTAWYVRLTHALVEEAKAAKRPNVFVDLEFDTFDVKFLVGNTGTSPAYNLRISADDSIPWRKLGDTPSGLAELSIIKSGLKYLAPGRTLKFNAGYVEDSPNFFATGSEVKINLQYETEAGLEVQQSLTIDLQSYSGVLYESFTDPEREVARAIRDTERDRSSREKMNSIAGRMFAKYCLTCGEKVSSKAKKCPHCHEFIPTEEPEVGA